VNNAVGYTTVVHKDPCIILDYTGDYFVSKSFQNPRLCVTQAFLNYFQKLHTSVKTDLNHTAYILIWYMW
jgi:hypothetical protein